MAQVSIKINGARLVSGRVNSAIQFPSEVKWHGQGLEGRSCTCMCARLWYKYTKKHSITECSQVSLVVLSKVLVVYTSQALESCIVTQITTLRWTSTIFWHNLYKLNTNKMTKNNVTLHNRGSQAMVCIPLVVLRLPLVAHGGIFFPCWQNNVYIISALELYCAHTLQSQLQTGPLNSSSTVVVVEIRGGIIPLHKQSCLVWSDWSGVIWTC